MRGSTEPDFKDRLEYGALKVVLGAFRLPPAGVSRAMGRGLGSFVSRAVPLRKTVALENLAHAFPDSTPSWREAIYRSMYKNLGMVLADFARLNGERETVASMITLDHPEYFEELTRLGRGGLLLTAHYGHWEALGAGGAATGAPLTVLGARQRNPLVEALFSRHRERLGIEALTVRSGLRPVVRALRAGRLVATLADQDGGRDGFFMPFLGRSASVQSGLFRLAARLRVPILFGFSHHDGTRWRGEIHPWFEPQPVDGDEAVEAEARRLAGLYTAEVETYVRRRPDHWFWVHRRWKTRPPAETAQQSS